MGESGRVSNREPYLNFDQWQPPGDWVFDGLCYRSYSDLFFPPRGGATLPTRRICARCPVWEECLVYATFVIYATDGIWGGSTVRERQAIRGGRLTISALRSHLDSLL